MKQLITTSILAIVAITSLTACVSNGESSSSNQNSTTVNDNRMQTVTHISTNKNSYTIGEKVLLTMQVKNTGKQPLTFLPWGTPIENSLTGNSLKVIYNNNETVDYSGIMASRREPIKSDYITLKTNETATGKINVLDGYQLDKKGTYSIQFNREYSKLPASNTVTIEVR